MSELSGRVALVTGTTRGIGSEVARQLADRGATVVVTWRDPEAAATVARELNRAADTPILVDAVCPGLTATWEGAERMGGRPVGDGAASVVWAATLPDDGPTGGFFRDGRPLPWYGS